jgi:hypothetical protein
MYDSLASAGVVTKPLAEWSQEMNDSLGTDLYSEGLHDNWIKRTSVGIDRLLEKTGLPQAGEEIGRSIGEAVGNPEAGASIGGGLPRMGVNMLPMFLPGPGWVGAAGMGALSGAESYTSTGSPTAGIIGAVTAGVMPKVTEVAEQAALRGLGARLVKGDYYGGTPIQMAAQEAAGATKTAVNKLYPETISQGILSQGAGQLAAGGLGVGSQVAEQVAAGEPVHVSPTEQLLNLTLGQAPFAAAYLTRGGRVPWGGEATRSHVAELENAIELTRGLKNFNENKAEISNKPSMEEIVDPPGSTAQEGDANTRISDIRLQTTGLEQEGSVLGQEKQDKLTDQESALVKLQGAQPGNIFGAQVMPDTPRTEVTGTILDEKPGWRRIQVADDPRNGDLAGKQIGYVTKDEPGVRPGELPDTQVFGVPQGHWAEFYQKELSSAAGDLVAPGEFDAGRALVEADQAVAAAKSGSDLQGAVVKLNGVRAHYGEAPIDDVALASILETRKVGDERAAIRAAINDARRTMDAHEEAGLQNKLVAQRTQVMRDLETAPDEMRGDLEAQLGDLNARIDKGHEPTAAVEPKPISYVPSRQSEQTGQVPVSVDIAKLDAAHGKAFPEERVAPGAEGGNRVRYDRFAKWVDSGQPMEMPVMTLDADGQPRFFRGSHRFAVIRDRGHKTMEVTVPPEQAEKFRAAFGSTEGKPEAGARGETKVFKKSDWDQLETHTEATATTGKLKRDADGNLWEWKEGGKRVKAQRVIEAQTPRDTMADVAKIEEVPHADSPATVPLTQLEVEKATRITQGTPHVEDQRKFIDFAQDGMEAFKKRYGMDQAALEAWVRQPHVADWTGKLADTMEVPNAPPTRKIGKDQVFTPETEQDLEFARRVGSNGRDMARSLAQSQDPVIRALAQDLARHDAALGAIDVHLRDMDTSFADLGDDGRAVIKLRANLRHEDAGSQDFTMMHELLHGLTLHELQNPANAEHVTALDALRQHVIDSLPKNLRVVMDDIQKTDWYRRYAEGGAKWDDYKEQLGPTHDMHTIYGLLNNDEFISQGLTSRLFRDQLARLKAPDGTSVYTKFVDFIKNVLGLRGEGSVLEQLMGRTDDLIGARNFQASVREYGERYFQNQGLNPKLATKQAERAVALMRGANEEAIQWMGLQKVDTPEIVKATKDLQEFMATPQSGTSRQALVEIGYAPGEASITQLATDLVLGKVKNPAEALRVLDPKVSAYVYAKVRDLGDLLGMVDNATRPEVEGRVGIGDQGKTREFAVNYLDNVNKALEAERQFVKDTTDIQGLNGVSPPGFLDASMRRPEPGPVDPPEVDTPAKKLTLLEKAFATANYLKNVSAEAAEWVSRGFQLESNMKKMKLTALQALGMDEKGKFNKEFLRTLQDPQVERAASKWMYHNYEQGKETGIQMLGRDDANIRQVLNSVPEGKRQAVENLVQRLTQANQVHQESIMNKMTDVALLNGAIKIAPETKLKVAQNMEFSKRMLDIAMSDTSNPQVQAENQVKLAGLQQELGPKAFDGLLQVSKNSAEMLQKQRAFNEANPAWTTMRKYGAYELEYRKGNKTLFDRVNSAKEGKQLVAERGGQIVRLERSGDAPDQPVDFGIPELQALQARQADLLRDAMPPDAVAQMVAQTEQPGYEDASFVRNHIGWIDQSSSYWTRKLFRTQTEALRNEPELLQRPDILEMLDKHSQNMLNPDPTIAAQVRRVLSTWYLGFTPATVMINGTQMLTRGATEMTNLTGKPIDAFRRVISGMKEATGLSKPSPELAKEREWLNRQIKDEGIVSAFNEGDPGNDGMEALQQALGRGRAQSKGQQLDGIHKAINQKAMWMFQQVEKFNNNAAITAAFDLHMERDGVRNLTGKAYEDARQAAYEKAKGFNQTVNDVGGRANRPIWAFSGKDDISRSAGVLGMAMQTYNVGTINQIANYIRKGFYDPAGLKPGEKHNARVALVQLLAVQTALAGALGVPFAGAAVAGINQVFPELEVNKNLKKWTNMLFAGDAEQGNVISDIAMNGIPSMFGWDLKSRLSMGNLLPGMSEFNGFHPETLAGPAVNLGAQLFKGVGQALTGQPGEALVTLMPPVAKKFVGLAADGFKVRDYNDRPVLDPTGGEMVGMALGFQPSRLTEWNTMQRVALGAEKMEAQRNKMFTQGLANQALEGKFGDIKQALRQKVQEDPNFKWEDAARSAARAAVELQFPRDLRREGSGSEQYAKTLRMFNMNVNLPTEMQRKQFEAQVLQGLGVRMDQRSLKRAQTVDALRAQNPRLTRYELNRLADASERRQGLVPVPAVGAAGSLP